MTSMTSGASACSSKLGLRERKKIQTRQSIRRAAYQLFAEQGYDATPVDQIAEVAEVSPSTVFRYFPTKEDIVLTDEHDPVIAEELRRRPPEEPPVTALREALSAVLTRMYEEDAAETRQRMNLMYDVPAIRARMTEHTSMTVRLLSEVLVDRTGRPADDLELRVVTGAAMGALAEAFNHWVENGKRHGMREVVDNALRVLERGLTL
ncbi:TetR/AcrR family transcriptional regulator [Streptomyces oceani]|uniref:TetR family transcriptional regulator n=1 Tax=Streptomyces oceani TaxID=1075402 RepID=A0A1E7KLZ8_9ACTN|nr:TetR family transcriptional regulator [Streptomyces oceani]OEV04851.1 TetR family transcriptional regulator [Streptomyces oceani]